MGLLVNPILANKRNVDYSEPTLSTASVISHDQHQMTIIHCTDDILVYLPLSNKLIINLIVKLNHTIQLVNGFTCRSV